MTAQRESKTQWTLAIIVAVGLAIDAYVHIHLAPDFAHVKTSTLSQADLFRVEAVAAIIAAVGVLVRRRRLTVGFAFLVAAAGLVAVVCTGTSTSVPSVRSPACTTPTGLRRRRR